MTRPREAPATEPVGATSLDGHVPAEVAQPDPLLGALVAERYLIRELIGEGGLGRVYRATHLQLAREVAIKLLHPEFSARADLLQRFEREARGASRLAHPGSVMVFDFGTWDGLLFIVMELVHGGSLENLIVAEAPLTTARIIELGSQLCDTLEAAHAMGLLHRDLKPENILITESQDGKEITKVCDYGLAFIIGDEARAGRITEEGSLLGTPAFMPPEQIMNRSPDQRTDIYALGCVLYEMACGSVPFSGPGPMDIITKQLYDEPEPPSRRTSQPVSRELERVILRTLMKDPANRPQSAADLRAALRSAAQAASRRGVRPATGEAQRPVDDGKLPDALSPPAIASGETGKQIPLPHDVLVVAPEAIPFERSVLPILRAQGTRIRSAHDFEDAHTAEAVVFDVRIDAPAGLRTLAQALARRPQLASGVLVVVGPDDDFASMTRALELGCAEYVPESLLASLPRKVRRALERTERRRGKS